MIPPIPVKRLHTGQDEASVEPQALGSAVAFPSRCYGIGTFIGAIMILGALTASARAAPSISSSSVLFAQAKEKGFAEEKLSTKLMVGGIVLFIVGSMVVLLVIAVKQVGKPSELAFAERGPPVKDTDVVRTYSGADGAVPAEIAQLGEPESVHTPTSIGEAFSELASKVGLASPARNTDKPIYTTHAQALVIQRQGKYTIIPWQGITDFLHPDGIITSDGQKFALSNNLSNYGTLYERLNTLLMEQILPQALTTIEQGGNVVFKPFSAVDPFEGMLSSVFAGFGGPLTITKRGLSYLNRSAGWMDLTSIKLTEYQRYGMTQYVVLSVRAQDSFLDWCRIRLDIVPNAPVLLELLRRLAPSHLLVPAGGGKWWGS